MYSLQCMYTMYPFNLGSITTHFIIWINHHSWFNYLNSRLQTVHPKCQKPTPIPPSVSLLLFSLPLPLSVSSWAAATFSPLIDLSGRRSPQPQHLPLPVSLHQGEERGHYHLWRDHDEKGPAVLCFQWVRERDVSLYQATNRKETLNSLFSCFIV